MDKIGVIILAGGLSKRMGADKGLLHFRGKPLVEHILQITSPISNSTLIIANNEAYKQFGVPVYKDIIKEKGPIGGIHTGLSCSNAKMNLVLACDMPMLNSDFLRGLIDMITDESQLIVPKHDDKIEPLCAIYHQSLLPALEKAAKSSDLSLHGFISSQDVKFHEIDKKSSYYSPYLFSNANNLAELQTLETVEE